MRIRPFNITRRLKLAATLATIAAANSAAAPDSFHLPAFPTPTLGAEVTSVRLLRELHKAGLRGFERLETSDADYALIGDNSLSVLSSWLEAVCQSIAFDLRRARSGHYDGTVFARLLNVATSAGALQDRPRALAVPIGVALCPREKPWGELPGDGATDVYVIVATEGGMMVYDPPTRQLTSLADFPNKAKILEIRF